MSAAGWSVLEALPRAERHEALCDLVVGELRAVLQMSPDEPVPLAESYFDFGLTSLTVEETKQRLEEALGCRIDAEVLFNHPTLEHLIGHLEAGPLSALFDGGASGTAAAPADTEEKALVDDMLARIYQS